MSVVAETAPDAPEKAEATPKRRRLRRALAWVGGVLGGLVLALIVFLLLVDWNWLRGPIGRYASAQLHREVVIDGDLVVHPWSLSPSATADRIRIGQPKWAGTGQMAQIGRLSTSVRLPALLLGRIDMPLLRVDRPQVSLIRDKQGRANWDFSDGRDKGKPLKLPPIRRFIIDDGHLRLEDARRGLVFEGQIQAVEKLGGQAHGFQLSGEGRLNREPFHLAVTGGPLLNIKRDRPYPFDADIRAGATRVTAKGAVPKPFDLGRLDMQVTAQGPDLSRLYTLTGVPLPNTPPYRLSARLLREDKVVRLENIAGRIGDSDLSGALSVDGGRARPFLKAALASRSLDFDDLAPVFGGAPKTGPGESASPDQQALARRMAAQQRLLPDATLAVDRLRSMDGDVSYRAAAIRDAPLPLTSGSVKLKLKDGVLRADPVDVNLNAGRIAGWVELDGRLATPVTNLDLRLSGARLEKLLPTRDGVAPVTGGLAGRVKLTGQGASVHRAAADADGEVLMVVPGGEIRKAFAELLGVNVVKGLGLLLAKDQDKTEIRCAVARFDVRDGVLNANRIVFDTGPVLGEGKGTVNLGAETMDLRLQGEPKKAQLIRVMAPVTLSGSLRGPKVGIEPGKALVQGGFAALLATIATPLAAVLPFVDPGLAKDAACGSLIAQAGQRGAPVTQAQAQAAARAD